MHAYAYTYAHTRTNTRRSICLHNFGSCSLRSSSALRQVLVLVREQKHFLNLAFAVALTLSLHDLVHPCPADLTQLSPAVMPTPPHTLTVIFTHKRTHAHANACASPQGSCRDPERSLKMPSKHALNSCRKANALAVRTGRLRSGTCRGLLT